MDRRRFPRRRVEHDQALVPAVLNVRVLDISAAGVLLHASHPIEPGARGRLRLNLGGSPITAEIQVQRVVKSDVPAGYRLGASFVSLGPELRHAIERFMTQ